MEYNFEKGKFTEADLEQAVIELFQEQGYIYECGSDIHRTDDEILLEDDLRSYLNDRYSEACLTENELQTIASQLVLISDTPLYLGNRETFRCVNEGINFEREDADAMPLHIDFINFDEPERNIFKVVNQFSVQGSLNRRPDLLLFVNGIPVVIWEFKTAIEEDTTVHDAWEQITIRYARDIPNLLKYCFLSVISDGANTRLGSIFSPYKYYYSWNKANNEERVVDGMSSLLTMIHGAFAKDRLCAILRDFIFYPDNSNKDEAIICRYPQFFATNALLKNIKEHLRPEGDGKGGTYFGATGCGKTLTMLFLARQIIHRDNATFHNPTIIIIADREDLDSQTSELFVTAKKYLGDDDVRSIETRQDLQDTLRDKPSGGVYITTIQKFCENTGRLSDRSNIICLSDEAHRTQTNVEGTARIVDKEVVETFGFAHYLRDSFPNATYCGFSGTPIDETFAVFGGKVDESYTMRESTADGITMTIAYEPRLARVLLSEEQARDIEKYYNQCAEEGATQEQIDESKKAMSSMSVILSHPDRIKKLAYDIVEHYETLCAEKPQVVQKAMIVCIDRQTAFNVLKEVLSLRPEWGKAKITDGTKELSRKELDELVSLPKINLVATQGANDEKELFDACGNKEHRKMLDKQFKNVNSNFKIAVVVDMWITGFDVPSLAVMYIDKPLQKHTLIQTISRVNRAFEGKDKGLVVDYIGIKEKMMKALKEYDAEEKKGKGKGEPIDELAVTLEIFRNLLKLLDELFVAFDSSKYFSGTSKEKYICLCLASEYVQDTEETKTRFMGLSRRLKSAYSICFPSGELTREEVVKAQFYLAIRSIVYKQTKGHAPDAEIMNEAVEEMVRQAISCTGIENIVNAEKYIDVFSEENLKKLDEIKLPITKFNALLQLLKKAIREYGHTNKVKAAQFDELLKKVVEEYNSRDKFTFASQVVSDFVDDLSSKLIKILRDLEEDRNSFEKMGISFEEKAFYDVLVNVRDTHKFEYADDKCVVLAKKIKEFVDDKAEYADWLSREDIKSQLNVDLTVLLYQNGYPPEWDDEVFEKVIEQAENFKKNNA